MILGKAQLQKERVLLDAKKGCLVFQNLGLTIYSKLEYNLYNYKQVSASVYSFLIHYKQKLHAFTASLADINKVLAKKKYTDLQTKLLDQIGLELYKVFNCTEVEKLPPY